jgi:hypothetical protein
MLREIKVNTWNRYTTANFTVVPEVMGTKHEFEFESFNITINIPPEDSANRDEGFDQVAYLGCWREDEGIKIPLEYEVHKVDLNIEVKELQNIPEEASNTSNVDSSIYDKEKRELLDKISDRYELIANRAFTYWLEILQWSSNAPLLGVGSPSSNLSGWGTYLIDPHTNNRVYSSTNRITVQRTTLVTDENWRLTLNRVQNQTELPMYIKFLHDAHVSMRSGNIHRATVELALCSENYLRYSVFELIPQNLMDDFVQFIEEANINQYLNRFFKNALGEEDKVKFNPLKKELSSLFNRRNKYMHMGKMEDITSERYERYLKAVKELLQIKLVNGVQGN